jgi:hypothetical protein
MPVSLEFLVAAPDCFLPPDLLSACLQKVNNAMCFLKVAFTTQRRPKIVVTALLSSKKPKISSENNLKMDPKNQQICLLYF